MQENKVVETVTDAAKSGFFTPKRLAAVAVTVVVAAGVTLWLKSRKNTEAGDEVVETVPVAEPKHGNKK